MEAPKKAGGDPKIATHFLDMNIPERFPCGATSAFEIKQAASRYFDRRHPGRAAKPKRQKIQETDFAVVCRYAWQSPYNAQGLEATAQAIGEWSSRPLACCAFVHSRLAERREGVVSSLFLFEGRIEQLDHILLT